MPIFYAPKLVHAIDNTLSQFHRYAEHVHTERWQGVDISKKPEMATWELRDYTLRADLADEMDLEWYRKSVRPSVPWADDHFLERVGGEPLNPGVQWAHWPWAQSARNFLDTTGNTQFSHTYMERYWPRRAGLEFPEHHDHVGIRHRYGDLLDLVQLLHEEPMTRQAYFPVWFPEDTGAHNKTRKPCTLGYWFCVRPPHIHTTYYIRSCDILRHFRDDVYLTIRLTLWILEKLRQADEAKGLEFWKTISPACFTMHIGSLHCFRNDWKALYGENREPTI